MTAPTTEPSIAESILVPTDAARTTSSWMEHELAAPIDLQAGQHLYIGVEMAGEVGGDRVCVNSCMDDGEDDRNYWSNAATVSYSWAQMASFAMDHDSCIEAIGAPE